MTGPRGHPGDTACYPLAGIRIDVERLVGDLKAVVRTFLRFIRTREGRGRIRGKMSQFLSPLAS